MLIKRLMNLSLNLNNPYFRAFLLGILILLFALGISSCAAHRAKICAQCPVITKDSTVYMDRIVVKDTTVFITQMSDPIYIDSPCSIYCDSLGHLKSFNIIKHDHGITKSIKSIGNSIQFDCAADSLKKVITLLQHNKSTTEKRLDTKTIEVNRITKLQGFWIVSSYAFLIFFAVQIIVKALTSIYPVTKPFIGWLYWMRF